MKKHWLLILVLAVVAYLLITRTSLLSSKMGVNSLGENLRGNPATLESNTSYPLGQVRGGY